MGIFDEIIKNKDKYRGVNPEPKPAVKFPRNDELFNRLPARLPLSGVLEKMKKEKDLSEEILKINKEIKDTWWRFTGFSIGASYENKELKTFDGLQFKGFLPGNTYYRDGLSSWDILYINKVISDYKGIGFIEHPVCTEWYSYIKNLGNEKAELHFSNGWPNDMQNSLVLFVPLKEKIEDYLLNVDPHKIADNGKNLKDDDCELYKWHQRLSELAKKN